MYLESNLHAFIKRYPEDFDLPSKVKNEVHYSNAKLAPTHHLIIEEKISKSRMMIFLGMGDAVFFKKMFAALKKQNFVFVLFERSTEVIKKLWSETDWREIIEHPRVFVFFGKKDSYTHAFEKEFTNSNLQAALGAYTFVKCHHLESESKTYDKMMEDFINAGSRGINRGAVFPEDTYIGIVNYFKNIDSLVSIPRLEEFRDLYKDLPGVVVSAGPSLKYSLAYLEKIKNSAVIVCVDAVYKLLISKNIIPHFVTCLERSGTQSFFENMTPQSETCLISTPVVQPETHAFFKGPQCFLPSFAHGHEFFYPNTKGNDLGASSATMAFVALNILGCKPIYLFGQDLAFDRYSDDSHVDGVWDDVREHGKNIHLNLKKESNNRNTNWVEGNDTKPILTQDCWVQFKEDFVRISQNRNSVIHNVIPVHYGAKIPGSVQVEPNQILEHFSKPEEVIRKQILFSGDAVKRKTEFLEAMRRAVVYFDEMLIPTVLELHQYLSEFYNYNPPLLDTAKLNKQYEECFSKLAHQENEIFQKDLFVVNGLLAPLFVYYIPKMNIDISKIQNEEIAFADRINKMVFVFFDHYKELLYWSLRLSDLLKKNLIIKSKT